MLGLAFSSLFAPKEYKPIFTDRGNLIEFPLILDPFPIGRQA